MSAFTYRAPESGDTYRVCGREVRIQYVELDSGAVLTFETARQARHYASRHGQLVRRAARWQKGER